MDRANTHCLTPWRFSVNVSSGPPEKSGNETAGRTGETGDWECRALWLRAVMCMSVGAVHVCMPEGVSCACVWVHMCVEVYGVNECVCA